MAPEGDSLSGRPLQPLIWITKTRLYYYHDVRLRILNGSNGVSVPGTSPSFCTWSLGEHSKALVDGVASHHLGLRWPGARRDGHDIGSRHVNVTSISNCRFINEPDNRFGRYTYYCIRRRRSGCVAIIGPSLAMVARRGRHLEEHSSLISIAVLCNGPSPDTSSPHSHNSPNQPSTGKSSLLTFLSTRLASSPQTLQEPSSSRCIP